MKFPSCCAAGWEFPTDCFVFFYCLLDRGRFSIPVAPVFGWLSKGMMLYRKRMHMQGCESTYFCVSHTEVKSIFKSIHPLCTTPQNGREGVSAAPISLALTCFLYLLPTLYGYSHGQSRFVDDSCFFIYKATRIKQNRDSFPPRTLRQQNFQSTFPVLFFVHLIDVLFGMCHLYRITCIQTTSPHIFFRCLFRSNFLILCAHK